MKPEKDILNNSLAKAFRVLSCFSVTKHELGVTEISKTTGMNKSTTYRMLATLEVLNLLEKNSNNSKYRLGWGLYELGCQFPMHENLILKIRPILELMAQETKETIHLAIPKSNQVFYLDKIVSSNQGLQVNTQMGTYRPLHCTGLGKVFLADLPVDKAEALLPEKLEKHTPNTLSTKVDLMRELRQIKKQGYALDDEEFERGLLCIAFPIYEKKNKLLAGVSISGPKQRFDFEQLDEYILRYQETLGNFHRTLKNAR